MKKYSDYRLVFLLLISLFAFFSCEEDTDVIPEPYSYFIPEQDGDGWETDDIANYNINLQPLAELADQINFGLIENVHSLLIVKNGKLIFEKYWPGNQFNFSGTNHHGNYIHFHKNLIHNQASVTKSVASILFGIAVDKGFISSVDEKVYDYFPEYLDSNSTAKMNMTLKHLLTMTSGYQWNESSTRYSDLSNDLIRMINDNDPLQYLMTRPLVSQPGQSFYYNSGCTNILGEIIYKASNIKADKFAEQNLFGPLGITKYSWVKLSNGIVFVSGDLYIRPRDMAKIGSLILNKGVWKGSRIVSEEWINASISKFIDVKENVGYGYQWWTEIHNYKSQQIESISARGWGGQRIQIFPQLDMVVVITGGNYVGYNPVEDIINGRVLPAVLN